MTGRPLLDLHDLGLRQTGNESWARSLGHALLDLGGPDAYDVAVTRSAPAADLARVGQGRSVVVSRSSLRRLAVDLPRALRRLDSSAVLVQYTAPLSRVPAVVAVHDLSFEDPRAGEWLAVAERLRYRATIRASVRRAARLLALSESTRDDLVRHYGLDPARVAVAPAAVDPAFARQLSAPREAAGGPATVLTVGNVLPRKNLVVVARAVRLLRDRGADLRLLVVGRVPPSGRAAASAMSALLGSHVEIAGYLAADELARAYRSSAVLAFPSLYEGFGIPVVEAMTAGTPVVVSDRTSLPEVVGDAGIVVPAEDAQAWADALTAALDPDRAAQLAAAGRARAAGYTWAQSASVVAATLEAAARSGAD